MKRNGWLLFKNLSMSVWWLFLFHRTTWWCHWSTRIQSTILILGFLLWWLQYLQSARERRVNKCADRVAFCSVIWAMQEKKLLEMQKCIPRQRCVSNATLAERVMRWLRETIKSIGVKAQSSKLAEFLMSQDLCATSISRANAGIAIYNLANQSDLDTCLFVRNGNRLLLTWNEHISVSSTDIIPPALSNSPQ